MVDEEKTEDQIPATPQSVTEEKKPYATPTLRKHDTLKQVTFSSHGSSVGATNEQSQSSQVPSETPAEREARLASRKDEPGWMAGFREQYADPVIKQGVADYQKSLRQRRNQIAGLPVGIREPNSGVKKQGDNT